LAQTEEEKVRVTFPPKKRRRESITDEDKTTTPAEPEKVEHYIQYQCHVCYSVCCTNITDIWTAHNFFVCIFVPFFLVQYFFAVCFLFQAFISPMTICFWIFLSHFSFVRTSFSFFVSLCVLD